MNHAATSAFYRDKRVLITGGLGFFGSNLAHRLVDCGARVTLVDSLHPLYGGNLFNVQDIARRIEIVIGDIRDSDLMDRLVSDCDIIFNFAAQVSHIDSAQIPYEDLDVNCRGHLVLLQACRNHNPGVKVIFSSSRMVVGKSNHESIDESHPTNPLSLYGIHKLTAEKYHFLYSKDYGVRTVVLRITNPYGPRQQIKHNKYAIAGWFARQAMEGRPIKIFGDGGQLRDYIYIDDLIDVFLLCGATDSVNGEIFNCGSGAAIPFRDMIEMIIKHAGTGSVTYVPWPADYARNETGDSKTDISKLRAALDWAPSVDLSDGVSRMISYYRQYKDHYIIPKL